MATLDEFLNTRDLDDLLKVRGQMRALTADELSRVADILHDWQDGQAISNLLFYPLLIPEPIRCDAIDRALHSAEKPYFVLAALVGLQSVDPGTVPAEIQKRWVARLLEIIRSDSLRARPGWTDRKSEWWCHTNWRIWGMPVHGLTGAD